MSDTDNQENKPEIITLKYDQSDDPNEYTKEHWKMCTCKCGCSEFKAFQDMLGIYLQCIDCSTYYYFSQE